MTTFRAGIAGFEVGRPRPGRRTLLSALLVAAVVASVLAARSDAAVLHGHGLPGVWAILGSMATPDLSAGFLVTVGQASLLTVSYAVAGMSVAVVIGLPGALIVSGVLFRTGWVRMVTSGLGRAAYAMLRSVHELVWALLLVFIVGLSPLAGILAIGLPYGAIIARVLGERLQDAPAEPLTALRSTGASAWQLAVYGYAPMVAADSLAYLFYRFECAIRAAAVLSFVGLGGIGYRIEIALADLRFDQVGTLLAALVVLIIVIDRVGRTARRRWAG